MNLLLGEIAALVDGKLIGDASFTIKGVAPLEDAKDGDLSFVLEENNFLSAESSGASALVVPKEINYSKKPIIKVDNPRLALAKILGKFTPVQNISPGIDSRAFIGENVVLGKRALVYPFAYIGNDCVIGDDCIIHPNVVIYPRTIIGKRCIIHAGCVIGVDGFGFVQIDGHFTKIPQIGRVIIENDVEIYANNSIARGAMGSTLIKSGTKIDNMNHIAHNVKIGLDCGITACNAFAGSSSIGDRVQIAGQSGIAPHVHVGDESIIMARSGVTKNIPPKSVILGYPGQDHMKEHKILALLRKLPDLFNRVKKLESKKP